ncbi:MAG: DNA mismatch repair endonuclease MutL [Candidatus Solibacter usitatus]|nr:DNA mismatch repair endonuclease MutL [Candidatus Solibacter usitatus]
MGRIRVLPDQVANKIAAGEVVERPASVVKELLENSLDAGATRLCIDVESGGRRLLRIADDGCGMLRDDALLAFERHATSKLRDVKDLLSIATLGFRGEALPSIASVSRLLLETRAPEEATGTQIEIAGGKMLRCQEAALASGTVVTVRDLFYNVPARKKFLRSDQTELAHIASLATHYSLAHPGKTFELTDSGNSLLRATPVGSLRERVYQVFGSQAMDELIPLGACTRELRLPAPSVPPPEAIAEYRREPDEPASRTFRLTGFVSRPQVQKSNRNSIFIFVNRRLIRDRLLLHAISSAYHNLMPPACFPFALLFLECDCEEVDVNVHPSKTEVRFRHQSFVHDFVRDALRERLIESRPAPAFSPGQTSGLPEFDSSLPLPESGLRSPAPLPEFSLAPAPAPAPRFDFGAGGIPLDAAAPAPVRLRVPDTHGGFPPEALAASPSSLTALGDLRPLGQIHESFIIAAGRDGLWIVDQHVAHERILFEQVLRQRASGRVEMQSLLMPMVLQLTAEQQIQYARIAGELNAIGFETEPFGHRTLAIKAAPAAVGPADLEKLVYEILENADAESRGLSMDDLRRGLAASIACRAAIKINTRLDHKKMEWLLAALAATDCPMSCPHGRPIALQYSTREILKAFHRI